MLNYNEMILTILDLQIHGNYRWLQHDSNQNYISNDNSYQVRYIADEKLDYKIIIFI